MSQIKLDPAYKRKIQAPRVGGFAHVPDQPASFRRSWPKLAYSTLACVLIGAGLVLSWPHVSSWFGLAP